MKRVVVVPYDSEWPRAFASSSREVAAAMGRNLVAIHHIGSTAIPGIHAKPVIDMLGIASYLADVDRRAGEMELLGYEAMGEFGIPGRRYFRRDNAAGTRTEQVHVFLEGSPHVERHLAFRDFMRAHATFAAQYGELKRRLAVAHPGDMEAYIDGKDAFIKEMEARALTWDRSRRHVAP